MPAHHMDGRHADARGRALKGDRAEARRWDADLLGANLQV